MKNYILSGLHTISVDRDGTLPHTGHRPAASSAIRSWLPVVFPNLLEEAESTSAVSGGFQDRVADFGKTHPHSSPRPIDYILFREWNIAASFSGAFLLLEGFLTEPLPSGLIGYDTQGKIQWILKTAVPTRLLYIGSWCPHSNECRCANCSMPPPASLKSILNPSPLCSETRKSSFANEAGIGYVMLAIAFSRLRYSYGLEASIRSAFSESFGPVSFQVLADCGSANLLLFYLDMDRMEIPMMRRRCSKCLATDQDMGKTGFLQNSRWRLENVRGAAFSIRSSP